MRDLKKLWFIWTARDPALIDEMDITNSCHSCSLGNSRIIHETEDLDGVDTPKYQQHKKMKLSPSSCALTVLTELPVDLTTDNQLEAELHYIYDERKFSYVDDTGEKYQKNNVAVRNCSGQKEGGKKKIQPSPSTCSLLRLHDQEATDDQTNGQMVLEDFDKRSRLPFEDIEAENKLSNMSGETTTSPQEQDLGLSVIGDHSNKKSCENNEVLNLECYITAKEMKKHKILS